MYKLKFGNISEKQITLFKPVPKRVHLKQIKEISIIEKEEKKAFFIFSYKTYEFKIRLRNGTKISFSFGERDLYQAKAFKNTILHMQFAMTT